MPDAVVNSGMNGLIEGYRVFRETIWPERRAAYEHLAEAGQTPTAAIIACSDSRLDPSAIFGAVPGGLFVVRNVANLVPPYAPDAAYHGTSAALEFAVRGLQVSMIVVMGHAMCGGVRALVEGAPGTLSDFVMPWMRIAERARERTLACDSPSGTWTPQDRLTACEHETVRVSIENLLTFPWIAERVASGQLTLHGAFYGIATGRLELLGEDGVFAAVE
jgi:carbonic anhydrase